jgi:hypothetical protein
VHLRYLERMASMTARLFVGAGLMVAQSTAVAQSRQILAAQGHWAALKFGPRCEASARPLPPASRRQPQARAGFTFAERGARQGEFHVRLTRIPRPGSSVMLTIGSRPFMLLSRGDWAWSRGPLQEAAILAAARGASAMRVEARDSAGRRFADRYPLDGAPTAIDAAAAGCAAKR